MKEIALITNSFPKISETFIYNKVDFLLKNGYSVTVIVHSKDNDAKSFPKNGLRGINIVEATTTSSGLYGFLRLTLSLFTKPLKLLQVYRFLRANTRSFKEQIKLILLYLPFLAKFDIIHFSFSGLAITYLPLLPFLKKNSLTYTSCRGHAEQIKPLTDFRRREELYALFSVIDRVHCVSEDIFKTCMPYGLNAEKVFINRPAIDATIFQKNTHSSTDKGIAIASVGRLHWKKAHETLLIAVRLLLDKNLDVKLYLAGDGPEREKLIYIAHLLKIQNHVVFLGVQTSLQIHDLLSKVNIYAHSSISEGISNSVMEAMAMELPVVCTDVGGMSELITDSIDGFLMPALHPEAIADQLILLAQDEELRKKLGQNARLKILKDFSLERQRDVYLSEYTMYALKKDDFTKS